MHNKCLLEERLTDGKGEAGELVVMSVSSQVGG